MKPLARGNADWLMDRAMTKAAKHLPLAYNEVWEIRRPLGWFVREALSLAVVAVAVITTIILIIGGTK